MNSAGCCLCDLSAAGSAIAYNRLFIRTSHLLFSLLPTSSSTFAAFDCKLALIVTIIRFIQSHIDNVACFDFTSDVSRALDCSYCFTTVLNSSGSCSGNFAILSCCSLLICWIT